MLMFIIVLWCLMVFFALALVRAGANADKDLERIWKKEFPPGWLKTQGHKE